MMTELDKPTTARRTEADVSGSPNESIEGQASKPRMSVVGMIFWPLGVLLFLEQFRYAILDPHFGADLLTFRAAALNLVHHVSPYPIAPQPNPFIFPPSSLIIFLPLAAFSATAVKYVYVVIQSFAFIIGGFITLRIFDIDWRSAAGGCVVFGLAMYVGLETNLAFSNVQGILVLTEGAFLYLASRDRWDWAGVALGISLGLKPSLLALLLMPVIWRQWRCLALSVGIPIIFSLIMLPFLPRTDVLVTQVLPYWLHGEANMWPQYNSTLVGIGPSLGMSSSVIWVARIVVGVIGLAAIAARWRSNVDNRLKIVEIGGMLVLLTLLDTSFSWPTYGWLLLPLIVSVVTPSSLLRTPFAWAAIYFFASPTDSLTPFGSGDFGSLHVRFGVGYLMLLLVMSLGALSVGSDTPASRTVTALLDLRWAARGRVFRQPLSRRS